MAWTDLSAAFAYGSKLTSAQMQNLRDNIAAAFAGDTGAPRLVNGAITSGTIAYTRLAYNAGQVNSVAGGGGSYHYECLGADGTWRRCSEDLTP